MKVYSINLLNISLCMVLLFLTGCSTLQTIEDKSHTTYFPPEENTTLSYIAASVNNQLDSDESAFSLVRNNKDALDLRIALANLAQSTIDAQYFIWLDDETGHLLLSKLVDAAQRGVRVRILIDDFPHDTIEKLIPDLSLHPNIEIRLFNPTYFRSKLLDTYLEWAFNFSALNRRMHNKMYTVDGKFSIIGGRNIGNPYFGLSSSYNFKDLDVLVAGPVVPQINTAFDDYWNSSLAVPIKHPHAEVKRSSFDQVRDSLNLSLSKSHELLQSYAYQDQAQALSFIETTQRMVPGKGVFIQDKPYKIEENGEKLFSRLQSKTNPVYEELILVTPYFIPGKDYRDSLIELAQTGAKISIVTNSLASTNQSLVHGHYKKYRRYLLKNDIVLHEFKHHPSTDLRKSSDVFPVTSSFTSLHTKAITVDGMSCFIGSLNLDRRALEINTENGIYIESPELVRELNEGFAELMTLDNSWRLYLDDNRHIRWHSYDENLYLQPARKKSQRFFDFFYQFLPIESQL